MNIPPAKVGYQERNIGRLSLVLALNRIGDIKGWHKQVIIDELGPVDLNCVSTDIVPHGLDADILFAIQTAFELQGRPVDRVVKLTMAQLCDLCCMKPGGQSYQRIQEGLERLRMVNYKAEACWGMEGRKGWQFWTNGFGLVDDVTSRKREDFHPQTEQEKLFTATTYLEIALNRNVVPTMRQGHIRTLSYTTMEALSQPMSRLLYRILEEQRPTSGNQYRLPLITWGQHLGLIELNPTTSETDGNLKDTRVIGPDRIRRVLQPAHTDLLNVNYLKDVQYEGRGRKAEIVYTFSDIDQKPVSQELLSDFLANDIKPATAERYIREYGEERAAYALKVLNQRLAGGLAVKNKAGFLVSAMRDPDKYPETTGASSRSIDVTPALASYTVVNGAKPAMHSSTQSIPEEISVPTLTLEERLNNAARLKKLAEPLAQQLRAALESGHITEEHISQLLQASATKATAVAQAIINELQSD